MKSLFARPLTGVVRLKFFEISSSIISTVNAGRDLRLADLVWQCEYGVARSRRVGREYSIPSLVRGFWDEEFSAKKPRTTEGPRSREGHNKSPLAFQ